MLAAHVRAAVTLSGLLLYFDPSTTVVVMVGIMYSIVHIDVHQLQFTSTSAFLRCTASYVCTVPLVSAITGDSSAGTAATVS
jgi:hypothetical protein